MSELALGSIFQAFRSDRHISLRQAAQGLTAATISRFERGEVDIKASYALSLMTNIGLDGAELDYIRGQSFPDPYPAFMRGDPQLVHDNAETYLTSHQTNSLTDLIKSSLPFLTEPDTPSKQFEQRLSDLLAYPLLWGNVEATILIAILPHASLEFCRLIWKRIAHQALNNPNWEQLTVATSALTLIRHEQLRLTIREDLMALLEKNRHSSRNLSTKPLLTIGAILAAPDNIDKQLDALNDLHAHTLVSYVERVQNSVKQPVTAWHNVVLKDNHQAKFDIDASQKIMTGPVLKLIRKHRGLTLDDVSINWNTSSQSRFEAGKIELGFTKLLSLLDTLMIPLSRAIIGLDDVTSFEHLQHKFQDMGEDIDHHTKAEFFNLVEQFKSDHSELPSGLLEMQTYAVKTSIARFAASVFEKTEDATPDISAKMQENVIEYVQGLPSLSHLDTVLLNMIVPGVDADHIKPLTIAILSKCKPRTPGESELYKHPATLSYGSLYFQQGDLLRHVANFFQYEPRFDKDWRIQRDCYRVKLLADAFEHPDEETIERAHAFIQALKRVTHFPDFAFMPDRWLQFAIDRDYNKLEH